jgi:hypothetical protein
VLYGGKISISRSCGFADVESERNVDERMAFRVASLGKPIFAYIEEKPLSGYSAKSLITTITGYARFVSYMIEASSIQGSVSAAVLKPQVDVARNVK